MLNCEMESELSTSVSLVSKFSPVMAVFSGVLGVSFATTGRSFTGVTVNFNSAESVPPLASAAV